MPHLPDNFAPDLGVLDSVVAETLPGLECARDGLAGFAALGSGVGEGEADGEDAAVFDGLGTALDRCGKEGVGGVPEETCQAVVGDPGRQRFAAHKFPVDAFRCSRYLLQIRQYKFPHAQNICYLAAP